MHRDGELLRRCAAGDFMRAVRLYWFVPACLSLGRFEPLADVDVDACSRDGVDIVRRPSGGRAVLHEDEVTYAVIARRADPVFGGDVLTSCSRIHRAIAVGLALLGVATTPHARTAAERREARTAAALADCFAQPSADELLDSDGRKLVGSAQARSGDALLQHGSVLLSPSRATAYLRSEAVLRGGRARGGATSPGLRALTGRALMREEAASALAQGFEQFLCAKPLDTTA